MHRDILCSWLISLHATKVRPLTRKRTLTHIRANGRMKNECSSRLKQFQISFERHEKMSSSFEFSKGKEINSKRLVLSFVNNDSPIKRKFGKKTFRFFFKITFSLLR